MKRKISITVLLFLLLTLASWGQISPLGLPFNRQYTPEEYKGSESNWSVTSDDHAEIAQSTEVMLQVRLYDIKGQLILEKEESLFDRQAIFDLDLSNLTPGIFILKIFSKDKPLKVMQILKN